MEHDRQSANVHNSSRRGSRALEVHAPRVNYGVSMSLVMLLMIVIMGAGAARADGLPTLIANVSIKGVYLSAAPAGGRSRLKLSIVNESSGDFVLLGVDAAVAQSSKLMARVGAREAIEIGSVPIPSDATVSLGSSHLWVTLERLRSPVRAGTQVPITIRFNRGAVRVLAHVHSGKEVMQ